MSEPTDAPQAIVDVFSARLLGNTDAGARVSANRADAVWEQELPALVVYAASSPAEERTQAPRVYWEDLEVRVEVFAKGTPATTGLPHDTNLSRLVWQAKRLLLPVLATLHALLPDDVTVDLARSGYRGTEKDFAADGRPLLGGARITFVVSYLLEVSTLDPAECDELREVLISTNVQSPGVSTGADEPDQQDLIDIEQ